MVANQPASIAAETKLSNEVRAQIGLAVPPQNKLSTYAGSQSPGNNAAGFTDFFSNQSEQLTSPTGIQSSIKVALLLATLSLAPAIILMTTCYIRVIVVLSLLRQAFGGQQLPPTQVMTALSVFLTFLIMTPVWSEVKTSAIDPYTQAENSISWEEAWNRGVVPVRKFMIRQIEMADNGESIELFYKYLPATTETQPTEISDVPLNVLLPAFMISELKVAFLLGFQIYLPFLVLDLVVSSVTVSMGMLMLPPNMISFPLKLILFVLVDGWNLVVGMLLQSFQAFT
jgi:flagellar biosynthetic protein FliP